jgi:hypothetical protein
MSKIEPYIYTFEVAIYFHYKDKSKDGKVFHSEEGWAHCYEQIDARIKADKLSGKELDHYEVINTASSRVENPAIDYDKYDF